MLWARTDMPGEADDVILKRAQAEERVVVTFDKDFGELAFRYGLPADCGIVLFRLQTHSPEHIRDRVTQTFALRSDWTGHLFVVDEYRTRTRPLPEVANESDETNSKD